MSIMVYIMRQSYVLSLIAMMVGIDYKNPMSLWICPEGQFGIMRLRQVMANSDLRDRLFYPFLLKLIVDYISCFLLCASP